MNTFILILEGILAFIFLFSGISKTYYDEETLVAKGQTGVEGLPAWQITTIGILEILGAVGLILSSAMWWSPYFGMTMALCLGGIMIPAAFIHYKRKEYKTIILNVVIFVLCLIVAWHHLKIAY